jgi:Peptidase C39 family
MNANWIGLLAVALSLCAFKITYHCAGQSTVGRKTKLFLLAALASIPSVLFTIHYLHLLPETEWFYQFRSLRGSELSVIPMGIAAGILATMIPRKWITTLMILLTTAGSIPYIKPLLVRLPSDFIHDQWSGNACLQSTPSTCGPASIATILKHLGLAASEREIARYAHTYAGGTEAWYLARYVRSRGLSATFDFRPGLPSDLKLPALVGVRLGGFGHFIPLLARDGDQLTIADPLHGMERISIADLEKRCQPTGFHLSIQRN